MFSDAANLQKATDMFQIFEGLFFVFCIKKAVFLSFRGLLGLFFCVLGLGERLVGQGGRERAYGLGDARLPTAKTGV